MKLARTLSAAAILCLAPVLFACATPQETFTRKELSGLSAQDMAARIFGAYVPKASHGFPVEFGSVDPNMPAPPWLKQANIYFKDYYDSNSGFCRSEELEATFEPVDAADAQKHTQGPPGYDPPTALTSIEVTHFFAHPGKPDANGKQHCGLDLDYFIASDVHEAGEAYYAFTEFHQIMAKDNPGIPISCVKEDPSVSCDDLTDALRNTASMIAVKYSTYLPQTHIEIIELDVDGPSGAYNYGLHLTLTNSELTGIELRLGKSLGTRPGH